MSARPGRRVGVPHLAGGYDRTPRPRRAAGPSPEARAWQAAAAALSAATADPATDPATLAALHTAEQAAWLAAHHSPRSRPAAPRLAAVPRAPVVGPAAPAPAPLARTFPLPNRLFADSIEGDPVMSERNGYQPALAAAGEAPTPKSRRPATHFTPEQDAAIRAWYGAGPARRRLDPLAAQLGVPVEAIGARARYLRMQGRLAPVAPDPPLRPRRPPTGR